MHASMLLLVLWALQATYPSGHAFHYLNRRASAVQQRRYPIQRLVISPTALLSGTHAIGRSLDDFTIGSSGDSNVDTKYKTTSRSLAIETAVKRIMELSSKHVAIPQSSTAKASSALSLEEGPSEGNTLDLLHGLLKSYCRWKSLPPAIAASLLQLITETTLTSKHSDSDSIIDTIWCLGKLRFDYKYSNVQFKQGVNYAVSSKVDRGKGVGKLLYGLSQMNFVWASADRATQEALMGALAQQLPNMNEMEVVNSVYALGKIGATWDVGYRPVLDALLLSVEREAPSMRGAGLANTIWGLSKTGLSWKNVPRSTQAALAAQFHRLGHRLGPHSVSSALVGFAGMQATWSLLQNPIRHSIEISIIKASLTDMNEQTVSMTLWALGALKAERNNMKRESFNKLFDGFEKYGSSLTSQGLCSSLYGMSLLGWTWAELPLSVRGTFEGYCAASKGSIQEHSAASMIYSLGRMRAQWHGASGSSPAERTLGARTCACLSVVVERNVRNMTEQGVCNTLLGLARMEASWRRLQPRLRYSLSHTLSLVTSSMAPQGISNMLWSLSVLGLEWSCLDDNHNISQALSSRLHALNDTLSTQALATSIHSLSKMSASYSSLDNNIRGAFQSSLVLRGVQMSPLEVSNTLYGLGRMNAAMKDLPVEVQTAIFAMVKCTCLDMNEQELGNAVWGLVGQMGVGYPNLPLELKCGLEAAILRSTLTKASVVAVLQGLAKAKDTTWRELPSGVRNKIIESVLLIAAESEDCNSPSSVVTEREEGRGGKVLFCSIALLMFGKLGVEWASDDMLGGTDSHATATHNNISSNNSNTNSSNNSNTNSIYSSSRVGLGSSGNARSVMLALFESFVTQLESGNEPPQDARPGRVMSNIFTGFALTGGSWTVLDPRVQKLLLACVANPRILAALNCNELATALWSLGRMAFSLSSLQKGQQEAVLSKLEKEMPDMNAYELTWTLWSMGQLMVSYAAVSEALRQAMVAAMDRQIHSMSRNDVGVVLWALERMRADFNDLPLQLREAVNSRLFFS